MEGIIFEPGMYFKLKNNEYLIRKYIDSQNIEVNNVSYRNQVEIFTINELLEAWYNNLLIVKDDNIKTNSFVKVHDFDMLSEKEQKLALQRYKLIEPVFLGEIKPSEIDNYLESFLEEDKKIIGSKSTLYKWIKRYKLSNDKRSLVSNNNFKKKYYNIDSAIISIIEDIVREEEFRGLKTTIRDKWIQAKLKIDEVNEMRINPDDKL